MREWARRGGRRSDVCLESEEVPGQHDEILHCAAMLVVGTVFSLVDERSQKSDVGHMLAKKPAEPLAGPVEIARVVETASECEQLIEGDRHGVGPRSWLHRWRAREDREADWNAAGGPDRLERHCHAFHWLRDIGRSGNERGASRGVGRDLARVHRLTGRE